jgi:hypothetical protein
MRNGRWKVVALLAAGIAIGIVMLGTPAGAHVAGWTHNWNKHVKPKTDARYHTKAASDARYLPGGNLARGRTIRGAYRVTGNDQIPGLDLDGNGISFGYTLASAPMPHFVGAGQDPPAPCPGTASNPQAAPGHLCVYELSASNVQTVAIGNPLSRYGVTLLGQSINDGTWVTLGTWAVTAP